MWLRQAQQAQDDRCRVGSAAGRRLAATAAVAGLTVMFAAACGSGTVPEGSSEGTEAPATSRAGASPVDSAPSAKASKRAESQAPSSAEAIPRVRATNSIGGFGRPWDLRFLPDGTPLVTERVGRISAVVNGERRVVAEVPGVVDQGEGGLMGLALDPEFEINRRIYTCLAAGSGETVSDVRVVRFRLSEDLSELTDAQPLVTGIPAGTGRRHLGCRLEVGPDGMLWITTGDAAQPTTPQDPSSRAGKVLRATLSGQPAPGNPGGSWDPYVYSLGHRNPQGLAFRSSDGAAFVVEHGTDCDDEINRLTPGGNYGWNPVDDSGEYENFSPMTAPEVNGAISAVWSSGCPTIAPSGAEFIAGKQWLDWEGQLAVAVLKDEELLVVALDDALAPTTTAVLEGELGRLRTVRNAPDGSLWLTVDSGPGALIRVAPQDE